MPKWNGSVDVVKSLFAEKVRIAVSGCIPLRDFTSIKSSLEYHSEFDHRLNAMVLQIGACVVGMPKERLVVHKAWPRDWWQAVKFRFFPAWLERRFPVVYDSIHIDRQIYGGICPHLNIPDQNGQHLHFLMQCNDDPFQARTPMRDP